MKKNTLVLNFEALLLSINSISWGLWIGLPFSPLYVLAASVVTPFELASAAIFGTLVTAAGVMKIVGIFRPATNLKEHGGLMGFLLWTFIFILLLASDYVATGMVFYPYFACANGWLYLKERIGKNGEV